MFLKPLGGKVVEKQYVSICRQIKVDFIQFSFF